MNQESRRKQYEEIQALKIRGKTHAYAKDETEMVVDLAGTRIQ